MSDLTFSSKFLIGFGFGFGFESFTSKDLVSDSLTNPSLVSDLVWVSCQILGFAHQYSKHLYFQNINILFFLFFISITFNHLAKLLFKHLI